MNTPWGKSQHIEQYPNGMRWISTASHGGFWLPAKLMKQLPSPVREKFKGWQWFEEDCDWAIIALCFPEFFKPEDIEHAKKSVSRWQPLEICRAFLVDYEPWKYDK